MGKKGKNYMGWKNDQCLPFGTKFLELLNVGSINAKPTMSKMAQKIAKMKEIMAKNRNKGKQPFRAKEVSQDVSKFVKNHNDAKKPINLTLKFSFDPPDEAQVFKEVQIQDPKIKRISNL